MFRDWRACKRSLAFSSLLVAACGDDTHTYIYLYMTHTLMYTYAYRNAHNNSYYQRCYVLTCLVVNVLLYMQAGWNQVGSKLESTCNQPEPSWNQAEASLEPSWNQAGTNPNQAGTKLQPIWNQAGTSLSLEPSCNQPGTKLEPS